MRASPPPEPHTTAGRVRGDPLARPILPGVAPGPAAGGPLWVGFGDEEPPPPARFIGFGDEDLRAPPPLPGRDEAPRPDALVGVALAPEARRPAAALRLPPGPSILRRTLAGALPQVRRQWFLTALSVLLLSYALFGRSAAYVGLRLGTESGIFVGELTLLFGLAVLIVKGGYEKFFALPLAMPWLFFALWNAAQTFPYISDYGLIALRDGAEWGYSLFAVALGAMLLSRPGGFVILLRNFRRFAWIFVLLLPAVIALSIYRDYNPSGMLAEVVFVRFGDALVTLVGVMAFAAGGLVSVRAPWWWLLGLEFVALASHNRGGLIAFLAGAMLLLLFNLDDLRGTVRRFAGFGGALAVMLLLSFVVDLRIHAFQNDRAISPQQLVLNLAGSFGNTGVEGLDDTREWRLEWWNKIIGYTLDGRYFWTGKGYGINLADADGFQVVEPGEGAPLRSPHNSHLTFLARAGVPGFLLWATLQLSWAWVLLRAFLWARRTRRRGTAALFTFFLVFWAAEMLEAATDVTFEAPFAAIWFWAVFGVGTAAAQMIRRDPDFFERLPVAAEAAKPRRAVPRRLPAPAVILPR